ncbi:MAG: RagB/SusD family nutrient uptake outer membrane protein [Bacteroidetes bacterium]|nr:MAG: RagB/SusD family nutrient uptake outer membrane protein [Bacteroidota bacterium]
MAGCKKEVLDLSPPSAIGDNAFYTNTKEVEGAVIAIYDGLQQVPLREFALTEMRSDNTRTKSSEGDWAQFESFAVQPTNQAVGTYWIANYNVIFRANRVLEHLDVVNSSLRGQFEGEARFARALAHFNLVRAYGGVPIVDKVIIQTDEEYFDRDAAEDVLAFVEADLTAAASLLPGRSGIEEGRATSGAANALLAKVKLTRGDYSGAESILSKLVTDPDYALVEEYSDVFYSEMNSEIIFAIPYLDDDTNESQDFSFEMTAGGAVSGLNFPTDDFKAAVDPNDTERAAVFFNPANPDETGKFVTRSSDARLCGNDWIVLRLADVYLMYAEAIMAGNSATSNPDAIAYYDAVRMRAGMPTLAEQGATELTKEMLLYERRMELAFENHRLYDLIRFGVAEEVLSAFATSEGYSFAPTDLLLPIPQGEINVSNGLLTQNPGY